MSESDLHATTAKPLQIAVFGGSFDPPHIGHVFLATYALSVGAVDRVLVVPTFEHAFGKPLNGFEHRLSMCELAFAPLRGVEVSPIERELGGVSRTLRLLRELGRRHPDARLRLLVGADILQESARWQSFDEICRIAPLLVAPRAGYAAAEGAPERAPLLPEVSSSAVRAALAGSEDVGSWIPAAVRAYIDEHALYRASAP